MVVSYNPVKLLTRPVLSPCLRTALFHRPLIRPPHVSPHAKAVVHNVLYPHSHPPPIPLPLSTTTTAPSKSKSQRIDEALTFMSKYPDKSARKAAQVYDINPSSVRKRLAGKSHS